MAIAAVDSPGCWWVFEFDGALAALNKAHCLCSFLEKLLIRYGGIVLGNGGFKGEND